MTATLCVLLVEQPLLAEAAVRLAPEKHRPAQKTPELEGTARVLHALNRFTFGPRPGDVAAVEKLGLDRWFETQLNPASIDDSRLDARLAEFPAMQLSVDQLAARYPGPQMIRAFEAGRLQLPADPQRRAVVEDQIAFYKMQKAKQAKAAPATGAVAGTPIMMNGTPATQDAEQDQMVTASGDAAGTSTLTREQVQRIVSLDPDQRVAAILALAPRDLIGLRQRLNQQERAQLTDGLSPDQKELLASLPGAGRMVAAELMDTRMLRDIYSDRQLEAVMTDFWLNHFNVYLRKNQQEPYLIPTYERETIRAHALGNFEDLLVATAKSPAMLVYLDNFRSVGPDSPAADRARQRTLRATEQNQINPGSKPAQANNAGLNENYGRELMELHTLGVNGGGYTQKDVTEVAKVFTGWGVARPERPGAGDGGTFSFDERKHEPGSKYVLGRTIQENGVDEGMQVLDMLATNPATAHFVCQKLAVRFVSDAPPPALVDRMAQSFLASHGDIKTVLRTMWKSPEFWAPANERAKVKTPEEFVISAVRASDAQVLNPQALVTALARLGQPFYGMQTPNGYSWTKDGWVSTGALVNRMNFSLVMTGDRVPGVRINWTRLLDGVPSAAPGLVKTAYATGSSTPEAKERKLEQALLGLPVSERTRATVLGQADDANVTAQAETSFDLRPEGGGKKAPKERERRLQPGTDGVAGAGTSDDPQAAVMAGLLLGSPEFQRR